MTNRITKKSKITLHWEVNPYDYSKEAENVILVKAAKKFGIPKDHIRVLPEFKLLSPSGEEMSLLSTVGDNIQNPTFQLNLFKEYLEVNNIQNYDFDIIQKIDAEINSHIDYSSYTDRSSYKIKWIKWDNFLSYGSNNYFDFSQLHGLVLLNGEPANQSGKTTFAIDLIHFLLFGHTDKAATFDKVFNKHVSEATEVVVEGCLEINGCDYIIKRRLTRPQLTKRSAKSKIIHKVEYYKIIGETLEPLVDEIENMEGESSVQTNKIIKEAIGSESDFDMILCATSSNLDDLIEKKETDRGKLLSRWIGLLPIEEKDILARDKFNKDIKPYLLSTRYNVETLHTEIDSYNINIKTLQKEIGNFTAENSEIEKNLDKLNQTKTVLLESKSTINQDILQLNSHTLKQRMDSITLSGQQKKQELNAINEELEAILDVQFSAEEYDKVNGDLTNIKLEIANKRLSYKMIKEQLKSILESEVCPTCGRRYEGIDNSAQIAEKESQLKVLVEEGNTLTQEEKRLNELSEQLKSNFQKYERKSKLSILKSTLELQISQLRQEYQEKKQLLDEYLKNTEAIDKNNKLDLEIRSLEMQIRHNINTKENNIQRIESHSHNVKAFTQCVNEREELIKKIEEESKLMRHWRIYLDMVGKNGISKMVLRKTLPIINAQLVRLLNGVCDFNVEVCINERNDVMFYLIKDGVKSDLTSGSGFERTAASLALRSVLSTMSTLPRLNILVIDEILGRVAKDNFDNMKLLYDKILENYDAILQISHLDEIKDWHQTIITVRKDVNVSQIVVKQQK